MKVAITGEDVKVIMRACESCHLPFTPRVVWQRFCRPACKQKALRNRGRQHPTLLGIESVFWQRVRKEESCWPWLGGTHQGYGRIVFKGQDLSAPAVAWTLAHGPIPKGQWVLHHCDNRRCVRAEHLFLGDIIANTRDRDQKGRQARGPRFSAVMRIVAARGARNAMANPVFRERARARRWRRAS